MRDVNPVENREVETSGGLENGSFTILANAKAFRILIDGLYSDKPRAIVRELWSNAFDSHREAGKEDVPFNCHLPTRFSPEFSVRDFGVSLSHEDIMGLYSTVFKSTKESSNVGVGKFGLGSKTPFAYTDQFTVTAWKDGEKRIYNAYVDAEGIPRISLFHKEESDEPQGLEVSFPVNPKNIDDFIRAAKQTVIGFDVFPNFTGFVIEKQEIGEVKMQGDFWRLYENKTDKYGYRLNDHFPASVRQGCVIYPLDGNALSSAMEKKGIDMSILSSSFIIDVPIGTVEITPNREQLSYDEKTINNIVDRLEIIIKKIVEDSLKMFENKNRMYVTDYYEFYEKAAASLKSSVPRNFHNFIFNNIYYRGKNIKNIHNISSYFDKEYKIKDKIKIIHCNDGSRRKLPGKWSDTAAMETITSNVSTAVKQENGYVIIRHTETEKVSYAGARVKQFIQDNGYNSYYNSPKVFWFNGTDNQLTRLFVLLKRPKSWKVINITDLPKPSYASTPTLGAKDKNTIWLKTFTLQDCKSISEVRVDPKQGGIYLGINRSNWSGLGIDGMGEDSTNKHLLFDQNKWIQILKEAVNLDFLEEDTPIYLVPRRSKKAVSLYTNVWLPLGEFLKDSCINSVSENNAKNFIVTREKGYISYQIPAHLENLNISSFRSTSILGNALLYFSSLKDTIPNADTVESKIISFGSKLGIYTPDLETIEKEKNEEYKTFNELISKVDSAYPLISETMNRYTNNNKERQKKIEDYVNMVDHYREIHNYSTLLSEFPLEE